MSKFKLWKICEIGKGSRILNVTMGDYSYCDRYADIANAWIGKFANIASFVRIGATDHPMDRASMHHFLYRSPDYWDDVEIDQIGLKSEHRVVLRLATTHGSVIMRRLNQRSQLDTVQSLHLAQWLQKMSHPSRLWQVCLRHRWENALIEKLLNA